MPFAGKGDGPLLWRLQRRICSSFAVGAFAGRYSERRPGKAGFEICLLKGMQNMEAVFTIRAHHGMCFAFFEGKGYSHEFVGHMEKIKRQLEGNPWIRVVNDTDQVCLYCPNNQEGQCHKPGQVAGYDNQVLELCGLQPGAVLTWKEFSDKVGSKVLKAHKRSGICGGCQWNPICLLQEAMWLNATNNSRL